MVFDQIKCTSFVQSLIYLAYWLKLYHHIHGYNIRDICKTQTEKWWAATFILYYNSSVLVNYVLQETIEWLGYL